MTPRRNILIATADRERAKSLEQACAERDLPCWVAADGARALESALAAPPAVIVASRDLELIDPETLASILSANPRTHSVRLVLLTDNGADDERLETCVSPTASASEVLAVVERVLSDGQRAAEVTRAAERNREIQGELTQLSLPDLVQLFHMNGKTGTIELDRGGEQGYIHLDAGEVVQATLGTVEGEKAFYRMLGWEEGSFGFTPELPAVSRSVTTPTRTLVMEGMRQLDEWARSVRALPSLDARVTLRVPRDQLPPSTHALTREVLMLLSIHERVGDLVDRCPFPDYQVLRTLEKLENRELIAIQEASHAAPTGDRDWFGPAQTRRLREWCERMGAGGGEHSARVLIVSPSVEASAGFVRALRDLPGLRLEGRFASGKQRSDDLLPMASVRLEADLRLELLHVPADADFAPVWPLAGHHSLGVVCLLAPPVSESAAAVRRVAEVLLCVPRARIVYAVAADKETARAGDGLAEELELLLSGTVVFLPTENRDALRDGLRELLAELLP